MIAGDEILQAILSASADRRKDALRILRGEEKEPSVPRQQHEAYLTLRETAKRLGISTATLWRWQVPGHSLGGRPRFKLSEVEAYLQSDAFKCRVAALRAIRKERATRETAIVPEAAPTSPRQLQSRRSPAADSRYTPAPNSQP